MCPHGFIGAGNHGLMSRARTETPTQEATMEHIGRPIIRDGQRPSRVVVLFCPYGHYVTSIPMKDWAGSMWEANLSRPEFTVRCSGALPAPARKE